jgi:YD repeat-containing protein
MTTSRRIALAALVAGAASAVSIGPPALRRAFEPASTALAQAQALPRTGQTSTRLPDGRWLLIGGEGVESDSAIWDPQTRTTMKTAGAMLAPRAWHTATLLRDGTTLVAGGRHGALLVESVELFDPATGVFTPVDLKGGVPRSGHSATLLIDRRVVVMGGTGASGQTLESEVWNLEAQTASMVGGTRIDRQGHTAALTADGEVLVSGGRLLDGRPATEAWLVDPVASTRRRAGPPLARSLPVVTASLPRNGDQDVAPDAGIALRFSEVLTVQSLTEQGFVLTGPSGPVATRVIPAEGGRLAFVWPAEPLADDAIHVLRIVGPVDGAGVPLAPTTLTFTTKRRPSEPFDTADADTWIPTQADRREWKTRRAPSPWESLPPLQAALGVTAIAGRALTLDGRPRPDVTLSMDGFKEVRTDRTGRFLLPLPAIGPGRHVLRIDGGTANRPNRKYGYFEYGLDVSLGNTTVLPATIWMARLDTQHIVKITSPTKAEVVITTPHIPGLELRIPPNTTIRGRDGKPVTEIGITPIPVDRPPFPLPKNPEVPVYFTVQPGSAYVATYGLGQRGAQLVYPNFGGGIAGQLIRFMHYEPEVRGWHVYGVGKVNAQETQVVPDPGTRVYKFTGAMILGGGSPPPGYSTPGKPGPKPLPADPVDPSTGVFVMHKTDLYLPDVVPLALTRTYNSGDNLARPFGTGMTHPYQMFLWSADEYDEADLILPEGGRIHFVRTSPGTGWTDAVFEHKATGSTSATPTAFYKAVMFWNGDGWDVKLKDGTVYVFGDMAPLQAIRDRHGNTVTIARANGQHGTVTRVTSPNGRWIEFTYDINDRVTQAKDNIGRTVAYTYSSGKLATVTDPENNVTTYTWTAGNQIETIEDGRGIVYLENAYTGGRVTSQTLADPGDTWEFDYTVDGSGNITQTDVTNPRGIVTRWAFNADHYLTSFTEALGETEERTTTYERESGSNLITAIEDELGRRTEFTHDSAGRVLTETRLADTADAVTTTYTYEPQFGQVATITDPSAIHGH